MHTTIERLRRLCRRLLAEGDLEFQWFGSKLDDFLCHRCRSLEEALGLRFARGGIPWWREEATRKRDAALRSLTERYFSEQRLSVQAKRVYEHAARYAASAWRRDRLRDAMPTRYAGTMHEWLWAAFASGAPMPLHERRLRDILQRSDRQRECRGWPGEVTGDGRLPNGTDLTRDGDHAGAQAATAPSSRSTEGSGWTAVCPSGRGAERCGSRSS